MNVGELDTTVINYINELKSYYEQQINILKNEINILKEKLDLQTYKQFARKAEKILVDDKQKPLFTNEVEPQDIVEESTTNDEMFANEDDSTEVKSYTRKKPGRKPINPNIPRVEKIIDIPESEKTCACGAKLTRIGEETSENLQRIPEQIYVEKIIRPKYACRCCEGTADEEKPAVKIAPVAPAIIPRSIASPSLLAAIFTHKFVDHLPYNRQEMQFERIGVEISRQDMTNWQQHIYQKHTPLFDLLKETVKSGEILKMDETTVQVMGEEGREDTQKSYMWLARGGPPGKTVVWYEYQKSRAAIL